MSGNNSLTTAVRSFAGAKDISKVGSEPTNRRKTKYTIKKLMVIYITRTVYFGCLKGRCIDDEENKTVNSNVFSRCVTYGLWRGV